MSERQPETGFLNRRLDGGGRRYAVYLPREYNPNTKWPLILFLHGSGERGDDGLQPTEPGFGRALRRWPDRFPIIAAMPQCPAKVFWDAAIDHVEAVYEAAMAEFPIDPDRIYLTGISIGGYAAWMLGAMNVDRYAALMPICGGGFEGDAAKLARVPIWAFHGEDDATVLPSESRRMVEAVRAAGGLVKYTEFKDTAHNAWDPAYSDPKAIAWLLKQRRTARAH